MSSIPPELKYVESHEWIKPLPDGSLLIGITDFAQHQLGDLVFVDLPQAGRALAAGEACAVVESVKAASDVYAPVAGEVLEANAALADEPELLNSDPYGDGWLWKMKAADPAALDGLLNAEAYAQSIT
jgi:glycine cleavage system H protein